MTELCRDCFTTSETPQEDARCPHCHSRRLISHDELFQLSIAHLDCDAFYASVEKRDNPSLRDKPVVIGGGTRGVVSAACYVARIYGIHSAMPMFKALEACPHAVVIRPNMEKYRIEGRKIREMMRDVTPLVEPLSIDEAFLDLTGTQSLHHQAPAVTLAKLAKRVEEELNLTISIGLSYNKFLAKVASDLDKPRGYAVIGRAEAEAFLADKPVTLIWGVGKALEKKLHNTGVYRIGDLKRFDERDLVSRFGVMGRRLYAFARGQDHRKVDPNAPTKSISGETTFNEDIAALDRLKEELWPLCETVSRRLKAANLAGQTVTLKLKTRDFKTLTRARKVSDPTQLAEVIYQAGAELLKAEADGRYFRLIGVGASDLTDGALADPPNLLEPKRVKEAKVEAAMDDLRKRLGDGVIRKGRSGKAS
jgi:DNA polymerase-4